MASHKVRAWGSGARSRVIAALLEEGVISFDVHSRRQDRHTRGTRKGSNGWVCRPDDKDAAFCRGMIANGGRRWTADPEIQEGLSDYYADQD